MSIHIEKLREITSHENNNCRIYENYIDFLESKKEFNSIEKRALENWGETLHDKSEQRVLPFEYHYHTIRSALNGRSILNGKVTLDIGCGEGTDIKSHAKKYQDKTFFGLDFGTNVDYLSSRDRDIKNLHYMRGDALNLPINSNTIDSVVSYGVFHHTSSPSKCMNEAYRVLKKDGTLAIYLYKNHKEMPLKYFGIICENILMKITSRIPISMAKAFCYLISPIALLLFSYPSLVLKILTKNEKIWKAFPLYWGTTPKSIIRDLQDRLFASVNFRYSLDEFYNLFKDAGFKEIEVQTTPAGNYGIGKK
ncbi:class I SAM-dependent methyltransferase [Bacteriovoracales bacterium]|nr:class I SAM-dependent methyltransferase [Bacteriovoracales bacterium]